MYCTCQCRHCSTFRCGFAIYWFVCLSECLTWVVVDENIVRGTVVGVGVEYTLGPEHICSPRLVARCPDRDALYHGTCTIGIGNGNGDDAVGRALHRFLVELPGRCGLKSIIRPFPQPVCFVTIWICLRDPRRGIERDEGIVALFSDLLSQFKGVFR